MSRYPKYLVLQVDSPSRKREIAEAETLEEVVEKIEEKTGGPQLVGKYQIPKAWTWHPLHPENKFKKLRRAKGNESRKYR